jgi:hypothetical protein
MASLGKPDRQHGMMDSEGSTNLAATYDQLCILLSAGVVGAGCEGWTPREWRKLVELAEAEGVAGLVYWAVSHESARLAIPVDVRNKLAQLYYADAAQNALLLNELDKLLRALTQAGVQVMGLKGATLGRELYPDQALRPMNDLDLLIRLPALRIATQVLRECGFRMLKSTYHIVFQGGPNQSVTVEVHWNLIGSSRAQTERYLERVWERAAPLVNGDRSVCRMHPIDCLPYLCAHLIWQHPQRQARLIWYYDLYLLLKRYGSDLDWGMLVEVALESGWAQPLYHALLGVEQRFGAQHPAGFLEELARKAPEIRELPGNGQAYEARMRRWLWSSTSSLPIGLRLRMWLGLLLPDPAYMIWRYQPSRGWLLPAYYPLRWWLLLRDGLAAWMR